MTVPNEYSASCSVESGLVSLKGLGSAVKWESFVFSHQTVNSRSGLRNAMGVGSKLLH